MVQEKVLLLFVITSFMLQKKHLMILQEQEAMKILIAKFWAFINNFTYFIFITSKIYQVEKVFDRHYDFKLPRCLWRRFRHREQKRFNNIFNFYNTLDRWRCFGQS